MDNLDKLFIPKGVVCPHCKSKNLKPYELC